MRAVKNKGSLIELTLGKALWEKGYRYRKNDKTVFGNPDFTFKKRKVAIFVDGEFWHGKDWDHKKFDHKSQILSSYLAVSLKHCYFQDYSNLYQSEEYVSDNDLQIKG